jgi:hypothetical protein
MLLLILVPAAIATVALLGLGMCRLAARSDSNQAVALADWIAASYRAEHKAGPVELSHEQIPLDPRGGPFRATG